MLKFIKERALFGSTKKIDQLSLILNILDILAILAIL